MKSLKERLGTESCKGARETFLLRLRTIGFRGQGLGGGKPVMAGSLLRKVKSEEISERRAGSSKDAGEASGPWTVREWRHY